MKAETENRTENHLLRADRQANVSVEPKGTTRVRKSVTIDRPRADLYNFWRNFQNLPQFMINVKQVLMRDPLHSHWAVAGPAGRNVEWDAVITHDIPHEIIGWRSVEDPDVENAGYVLFRDAHIGGGTVVTVVLIYNPPAGKLGKWVAALFGAEPALQISQDLARFKALMETQEIPTAGDIRPGADAPKVDEKARTL